MWKIAAFENLLTKERQIEPEPGVNLIALGDQFPEIRAARHVAALIGGSSAVKTVKFQEAPSISELIGQLSRTERILSKIVTEAKSQAYRLVRRDLSAWPDQLASAASEWKCLSDEGGEGCVDPMASIKDLMGF